MPKCKIQDLRGKITQPPGGFQTFTVNDFDPRRSDSPHTPRARKAVSNFPQSGMKYVIEQVPPERSVPKKKSFRVSPGGNTTIEQCLHLEV